FSPLFIGEYSATIEEIGDTAAGALFQSPLHRGILCNVHPIVKVWVDPAPFSPLFIGEYSATGGSFRGIKAAERLSVPSSSGNTLQRHGSPRTHGQLQLSVPSSSGNTLQLQAAMDATFGIKAFSPLFIGEYSATFTARTHAETLE